MRLTERDARLLRDLVLSHVMTRDQTIALGYFGSVTRANARLRLLREAGLVRAVGTPFFGQTLHAALPAAAEVVDGRFAPLAVLRTGTPRFLQHALCVTNVRIAMLARGVGDWLFEPELRRRFRWQGADREVRPDGMGVDAALPVGDPGRIVAVEADLGNVAPAKFREKLLAYGAFAESGECRRAWGQDAFTLLVVTPDAARADRLARLVPEPRGYALVCRPCDRLGVRYANAWS